MRRHIRHVVPLIRSWAAYAALPAAGIITAPILAHALGPTGRGQLAGILQPMTLASAVAALGVPSAVTFFIGQRQQAGKVVDTAVKISLIMTLLVGIGLILYSGPVAQQLKTDRLSILLIWAAFLPSAIVSIRRGHIQGLRRYGVLDLERTLAAGFRVGIILLLWIFGVKNVIVFAAAYMVAGLVASAVLRLPKGTEIAGATNKDEVDTAPLSNFTIKSFMSYSMLSAFGTIAAAMSARLDQAIMPAVVSANDLGYYSVAVSVAEISTIITAVLTRNILAEVASGVSGRTVIRSVAVGGLAQVALIVAMLVALPSVVPIVFGRDFGPAMGLIRILLLGAFVSYWANVAATYLGGLGKPGYSSLGQAAAALVTILLFWIGWHHMNSVNAAWISVWSQMAALITAVLLLVRVRISASGEPIATSNKIEATLNKNGTN